MSLEEHKKCLAELKSRTNCQACGARGHWAGDDTCPKNAKNEGTLQSPARAYLTIGGETSGFDLALTGDEMSLHATALVAHARLDASDIPVETPPKAPPGTRRPRKPPRVIPSPPPPTPQCTQEDVTNTVVEVRTQRLNVSLARYLKEHPQVKYEYHDVTMDEVKELVGSSDSD